MPVIDVANADLLLTTTKQVRKRLDLSRPVPRELLLECIDIASHAPMGGNLERNRWMIIDDPATKAEIAPLYQSVGQPYLAANSEGAEGRQARVVDSAAFLVEHVADVPAWVLAMRLDRLQKGAPNFEVAGYHGSVAPGVWSFQLAARARGLGSAWTTFHLVHEKQVGEILGIPATVTQIALLPVAFYTGDESRRHLAVRRTRSRTRIGGRNLSSADPGDSRRTARVSSACLSRDRLDAFKRGLHPLLEVGLAIRDSHDVPLDKRQELRRVIEHLERLDEVGATAGGGLEPVGPFRRRSHRMRHEGEPPSARSASMISGLVLHRARPRLLVPLNRTPGAGPVAPSSHTHSTVSGLHSPIRVTSDTRSYRASADMSTWIPASPTVPFCTA